MARLTATEQPGTTGGSQRVIDLDVVRAVALTGVVLMNYHGYLILRGAPRGTTFVGRLFDPWTGQLSTRFAAAFVMVAGMGVTLLTNRSRRSGDRVARRVDRWVLVRRGTLLYGGGYVLNWIWDGTILFFYGAFFLVGALVFTLRLRWLVAIGAAAAAAGASIKWWGFVRSSGGHDTSWLFSGSERSPRSLVFDTFVNGTHPLLPWLAFFCAGMALGRMLPLTSMQRIVLGFGSAAVVPLTYALSSAVGTTPLRALVVSTHPFDRSVVYTVGTLASAIAAFCLIGALAERTADAAPTRALALAGRTTLTIYVLHILVFNGLVDWLGWVRPTGLDTAALFAGAFWLVTVTAAAWWNRSWGMGPLERVYRAYGGAH
jgi:uncharacterized membrane protein YeiB